MHLPTIGEVRPVNEGVQLSVLNHGVLGHYPGTAEPGGVGHFALAGHRTTYGRPLWAVASLRPGDPVVVETATDYYVYRLSELRIVQPEQSEVVAPVPGRPGTAPTERWMVMTACHPKFSASQRIVALSSRPLADDVPATGVCCERAMKPKSGESPALSRNGEASPRMRGG